MKRILAILATAAAIAGCEPDVTMGPDLHRVHMGSSFRERAMNVATYNVYVGAHIQELLMAEPSQIPIVAAGLWGDVQATNFPERAAAIAKQIDDANSLVVGLQEVALYRYEPVSDYAGGELPPPDAEIVLVNFLEVLIGALEARGLSYTPAAQIAGLDIELPMCTEPEFCVPLADIRLTEYEVVLVRDGVPWENPTSGNYAAALPIDLGGQVLFKPSGWASVDFEYRDRQYRFVTTHLEPADVLPGGGVHPDIALIQGLQLEELLGIVEASAHPVIMVGDFNSDANGSTTQTYQVVVDWGFVDTWAARRRHGLGYTANQAPNLLNETSQLFHRIDFVFYRDEFTRKRGRLGGRVMAELMGEEQVDRTESGLWPSDHAGVAVSLRLAQRGKRR